MTPSGLTWLPRVAAALTALAALGAISGAGARWPLVTELAGLAALLALGTLTWQRLLRGPRPSTLEQALALGGGLALALATLVGGRAASVHPPLEAVCRRMALASGLLVLVALGALAALPRLRTWWGEGVRGQAPGPAPSTAGIAGRALVVVAWLVIHLPALVVLPPLLQPDSSTNAVEPPLLTAAGLPNHHPPLYPELIRGACAATSILVGLTGVVLLQHLAVLMVALLLEDLVRRVSGDRWVAAVAGVLVAIDATLLAYAQLIMSEALAMGFLTAAVVALGRAERAARPASLLLAAGACAALATLTRQVAQAWFLLASAWVLLSPLVPRARALAALLAAALAPLLLMMAHNYVFLGRASLSASWGRSLTARLVIDMPRASHASPDPELERARSLIWRDREALVWGPIHQSLREELGWDDARIAGAVQRLFLAQVRAHPLVFLESTLSGAWQILSHSERLSDLVAYHDRVRPHALQGWQMLPDVGPIPGWVPLLDPLAVTHTWPLLLLAACAPCLARGGARRLALLAICSAGYLVLIPALVEQPLPRYRLPAVPYLALAAALGLAGLHERLQGSGAANAAPG